MWTQWPEAAAVAAGVKMVLRNPRGHTDIQKGDLRVLYRLGEATDAPTFFGPDDLTNGWADHNISLSGTSVLSYEAETKNAEGLV